MTAKRWSLHDRTGTDFMRVMQVTSFASRLDQVNSRGVGDMSTDHRRDTLLRLSDVKGRTGLSRSTIYRRMGAGTFPHSIRISAGLVAWYQTDIDAWVADPMGWREPS